MTDFRHRSYPATSMCGAAGGTTITSMTTTRSTPPSGRLGQATALVARALAGRRYFPLWAGVHPRGRTTGRALSVPVAVRATSDAFVIVLPWGPGTNWARNVLAAGECVMTWKGVDHRVTRPELITTADARPYFGPVTWTVVQRLIRAESFLRLHR
jgi:hypothetical protein